LRVTDNRVVLPNLGKENIHGISAGYRFSAALADQDTPKVISTGKKLIPGSIEINLVHVADPSNVVAIKDNGAGSLLAAASVLSAGTVDYSTGKIEFTLGTGFTVATGDQYAVTCYEDVAGTPEFGAQPGNPMNRFKLDLKSITVKAEPDMLVGESNLMAMAQMNKSLGSNPQEVLGAKLVELYTKLINEKIVKATMRAFNGNAYAIEATGWKTQFMDFNSRLDAFSSEMVNIDTKLAQRSVKGVKATAYIVGTRMGNWFRKLRSTGNFVENTDSTYINDLLGHYNGIPVLRHDIIGEQEGYAICKTAGGEAAPVMRGIYLPLTWTPAIGS
jgi:hypothetical protein